MNIDPLFIGDKRPLIKDDVINAQIEAIKNRLEYIKNENADIEYYMRFYKDYFSFRSFTIKNDKVSSISSMLNSICKKQISVDGEVIKLIKCNTHSATWAKYVFSENVLRKMIEELK